MDSSSDPQCESEERDCIASSCFEGSDLVTWLLQPAGKVVLDLDYMN